MISNHELTLALRSLDAASPAASGLDANARSALQRIVAEKPRAPSRRVWRRAARDVRQRRRCVVPLAATAVLALVVVALVVALPSVSRSDMALASWVPVPTQIAPQQAPGAASGCRRHLREAAGPAIRADLAAATAAVSERRGAWTTVLLVGPQGFSGLCITDDSAGLFDQGMIGSVGRHADHAVASRDATATDLGDGSLSAGELSLAAGVCGSDVIGLTYASRSHGQVVATVSQGHFAFWFPGDELRNASSTGVPVTLTFKDGATGNAVLTLQ